MDFLAKKGALNALNSAVDTPIGNESSSDTPTGAKQDGKQPLNCFGLFRRRRHGNYDPEEFEEDRMSDLTGLAQKIGFAGITRLKRKISAAKNQASQRLNAIATGAPDIVPSGDVYGPDGRDESSPIIINCDTQINLPLAWDNRNSRVYYTIDGSMPVPDFDSVDHKRDMDKLVGKLFQERKDAMLVASMGAEDNSAEDPAAAGTDAEGKVLKKSASMVRKNMVKAKIDDMQLKKDLSMIASKQLQRKWDLSRGSTHQYRGCTVDCLSKAASRLDYEPYSRIAKPSHGRGSHNSSDSAKDQAQEQQEREHKPAGLCIAEPGTHELKVMSTKKGRAVSAVHSKTFEVRDQRALLVALYEALGGKLWHCKDNWCSDRPISEWHGVEVEDGWVRKLDLSKNRLQGRLPHSICDFAGLQYLYLQHNQIDGSLPDEIGNLTDLQHCYLFDNLLEGTVPETICLCSGLEHLFIHNNRLSSKKTRSGHDITKLLRTTLGNHVQCHTDFDF